MSDDGNDLSDEEVAYHELFENAQKAIHNSEANQKRSKAVREELEAYIDSAVELKGSDGSALIRIPSNFETIVNSMNREDLSAEASEDKPWSQYLLLDGLNSEDDKEYNGRYARSFRDTSDVKIKRGLAQIQLLDRQLQEITRANHTESTPTSPRADETFITSKLARGEGGLSPVVKKEAKRDPNEALGKKTANNSKYTVEKDREQQRLAYLMGIEPGDEKGIEPYWDPELQAASDAIDERLLAEFGRWELLKLNEEEQEANVDTATELNGACDDEPPGMGKGGKRERKVDYLHELRAARLESERVQRLDSRIETCSSHPIEYEALLPKVPPSQPSSYSHSSSRWRGSSSSSGMDSLVGDMLALPDPAEVQPERVVTFEDIQELIALLNGGGEEGVSTPSNRGAAFSFPSGADVDVDVDESTPAVPHTAITAEAGQEGEGKYRVFAVDKEGIKALVRQHKKDIEALGRLRTNKQHRQQQHLLLSPREKSEGEAGRVKGKDAEDEDEAASTTVTVTTTTGNSRKTERWLDLNEEVPASTINAAHPAVAATTTAVVMAGGNARRPRAVTVAGGGVVAAAAAAVGEPLPPIPPLYHTAQSEERGGGDGGGGGCRSSGAPAQPLLLDQRSKSQSASLAMDFEEEMSTMSAYSVPANEHQIKEISTDQISSPAAASPRAAGGAAVKKSLRLPRGLLQQAQLGVTAASAASAAAAGSTAPARGGADPRHGLTVFRSVNSELERQQLHGARLVKKIGAVLTAEREAHGSSVGIVGNFGMDVAAVGGGSASGGHPLYHPHRAHGHTKRNNHQRPHHLHHHQNQPQQGEEESSFELSPSSARRALKARNVLDSMGSAAAAAGRGSSLLHFGDNTTNTAAPAQAPLPAAAHERGNTYSDIMRI